MDNELGTLTVANCTFSNNTASGGGGAIYNMSGAVTLQYSVFSTNTIIAVVNNTGTLTIQNSTFSGNSAPASDGGGVLNWGTTAVTNSTFSGNSAPSGGGI